MTNDCDQNYTQANVLHIIDTHYISSQFLVFYFIIVSRERANRHYHLPHEFNVHIWCADDAVVIGEGVCQCPLATTYAATATYRRPLVVMRCCPADR